jgi:hypothetical protein
MSDYATEMNDHSRNDAREAIAQLHAINFADALGETSMRARRALLALSIVAIVFAKYTISVRQIPWLEIPAPVDAAALIPTLLFVAIAYHWVSFALYGLADAIKWETTKDRSIFGSRAQLVYRLAEHIRRFEAAASSIPPGTDLGRWIDTQSQMVADARAVSQSAIDEWNGFYALSMRGFWLKRLTVWIWEIALPLAFGVLASIWLYRARLA